VKVKQNGKARKLMIWLWRSLPFFSLCTGLFIVIVFLTMNIQAEKTRIEEENRQAMQQEKTGVNVITLNLAAEAIAEKLRFPGEVRPWVELQLPAEVRGTLVRKFIEEGTTVKKGDRLGQIDARDYRNALTSATASYTRAAADFERQKNCSTIS
jgi:multidrug efflux pump subunit AcrA (membrane-fusion protein)